MSVERDHELERLALADRHVADAERHIAEQLGRIEQMGGGDQAVEAAEGLLVTLNAMLMEWRTQREVIVRRLRDIEVGDGHSD